jgi:hypothetical protein
MGAGTAKDFIIGGTVTLTPTPRTGWVFRGWSGDDPECLDGAVTMDASTRCLANFVRV